MAPHTNRRAERLSARSTGEAVEGLGGTIASDLDPLKALKPNQHRGDAASLMNMFTRARNYAHGDRLQVAGAPVRLRVDGRARRVSLRLDAGRREVIAT